MRNLGMEFRSSIVPYLFSWERPDVPSAFKKTLGNTNTTELFPGLAAVG